MNRDEAFQALGLDRTLSPVEIERALVERVTLLEQRVASAPTPVLKDKYRRQLDEIDEARAVLVAGPAVGGLSRTMIADLPLAQAAYTGTGSAPGLGGITLARGQVLSDRFELREVIGAGGMGVVYRAFDRIRDKDVAIKVLLPQLLSSPRARERFLREARLASEMSHPNITTVFDVQQDGVYVFLTMELLLGQSLRALLKRHKEQRRPMPVDEALTIIDSICQALAYAHERTVHRDVKPENIWLTEEGRPKLMDFGIALLNEMPAEAQTLSQAGTPYYMAPEQLAGAEGVDGRADQYAVAVMLYEMLASQLPSGRIDSLQHLRSDVPAAVSKAVDRALSARPAERFEDIAAFREALQRRSLALGALAKRWIAAGSGAAALVALVITFPHWRTLLPDPGARSAAKHEAARLQGEIKSMLRLVDTRRREVADAASNARRDSERLEAQLRSARTADERGAAQGALFEAQAEATLLADVNRRLSSMLDAPKGLTAVEGTISAGEAALKDGDVAQAQTLFNNALDALNQARAMPDALRTEILRARSTLLSQLDGKWALQPSCEGASTWTTKDFVLRQFWPDAGLAEERLLRSDAGALTTVVLNPAQQRGRLYRYTLAGAALQVEDLSAGRRQSLFRCQ